MPDSPEPPPDRIDAIETRWSIIRRAHNASITSAGTARNDLVTRYSTAVRRYVRAIMQNDADADEVAQDVVVRMLGGDFSGADPERGRFRDFLKVAVRNMVRNYWSKQNRRKGVALDIQQMDAPDDSGPDEGPWLSSWRRSVLDLAWAALEDYQRANKGNISYTLLRLRTEFPDDTSDELAQRLGKKLGRNVRADAVRQQIRRARVRFAELLVKEIADGLDNPTPDRIEDELVAVGLLDLVKDYLPADWKTSGRFGS